MRRGLSRVHRLATAAAVVLAVQTWGRAAGDEASCPRPEITKLRSDEDYSFLRDPACRTEPGDVLKYLELSRALQAYLSLGVDLRERFEHFTALDWRLTEADPTGILLQRLMPHVDVHVGARFRVFAQLTSNLVWGGAAPPLDRDELDLLQAFGELSFGPLSVRAGRQELQYASSRLVSIRDGPNVRLAFDGVRVMARFKRWQVDGFGVVPVEVRPGVFDDRPEPGQGFWGVYATGPVLAESLGLDLYYLGRFRQEAAYEQGTARELRHTVGARLWGEPGNVDYNAEVAYQAGRFGAGAISAWMVASDVGYTLDALPARPRLGGQANATSGDVTPGDPGLQTFNPLFPRGAYFSEANLIGPLNLVDLHPALRLSPGAGVKLTLDWDFFWRESLDDGLYLPSAALQVPGAGNPARYVGSQGAVLAEWQVTRHAAVSATYSHFFSGPFLQRAGRGYDIDFVGLWLTGAY